MAGLAEEARETRDNRIDFLLAVNGEDSSVGNPVSRLPQL